MSNYPFGLRGDPFVPPATLSAKEASRLIRRRIRACNGDGGLLYPIDACDAIHALARGVPDAVLALAGQALAVAAAEGARSVSPAHVKKAAESGTAAAARESAAAAPTPEPVAVEAEPPAAAPESPRAEKAAAPSQEPAPPPATSGKRRKEEKDRRAEPPREVAPDESALPAEAFDAFDDSDLPPFQPASMALPTQPSEDLPEDAREWVSRFIPSQPGAPPVAESDAPRVPRTPAPHHRGPAESHERHEPHESPALGRPPAVNSPAPRRGGRRPGRRQNSSRMLVGVLGVVTVLAIVLRYSTPEHLTTPNRESRRTVRTSAPRVERRAPARSPEVTVLTPERQDPANPGPPPGSSFYEAHDASRTGSSPTLGSAPRAGAENTPAVEPVRRTSTSSKFALEVASFIFEERARQERDRLSEAGLHARVITTLEFGSRVYRVVIGGYPHPAAAERAADSLLSNGVVLQARVVTTQAP